jgi:hypothetical protein
MEPPNKLIELTKDALRPVNIFYLNAWTALAGLFVLVLLMWLFNIFGAQWLNIPFALAGLAMILFVGFAPSNMKHSLVLGGISAVFRQRKLYEELRSGISVHYRIIIAAAYAYTMTAFTLMTWSFVESPGSFWIGFTGVLVLLMAQQLYGIGARMMPIFVTGYVALCIMISLWGTLGGAYSGRAFDPQTGAALYMVDPTTGNIDSLKRTPAKCQMSNCYSAETGAKLVPMNQNQALTRNVSAWPKLGVEAAQSVVGTSIGTIALATVGVIALIVVIVWLFRMNKEARDKSIHVAEWLIGFAAIGGALVVFTTWEKEDVLCPDKQQIVSVPAQGMVVNLKSCWNEEFVTLDLRQVGITKLSFNEESKVLKGRTISEFARIQTNQPGATDGQGRLVFNSAEMRRYGITTLSVFVGPAEHQPGAVPNFTDADIRALAQ